MEEACRSKGATSKFVAEHVEESLGQEDKVGYPSKAEMIKQLRKKNEEIAKLRGRTGFSRLS